MKCTRLKQKQSRSKERGKKRGERKREEKKKIKEFRKNEGKFKQAGAQQCATMC